MFQIIPVYGLEPSSLISYTLRSVEFLAAVNDLSTEEVRSCRDRGVPTLEALELKIQERIDRRKNDPDWIMNDLLAHIPKYK